MLTGHHRNLVMQWSLRPQECVDLLGDRALAPPLYDRIEQQPVREEQRSRVSNQKSSTIKIQTAEEERTRRHP